MIKYFALFAGIVAGSGCLVVQAETSIEKDCIKNGQYVESAKCDHRRLLKEGNNIYVIHLSTAQRKLELVEDKLKVKKVPIQDLITEGTCLAGDTNDACIERLRREALDAKLKARETILKNNAARAEITGSKDGGAVIGLESDGAKKDTILKDLAGVVKEANKKGDPNAAFKLLASPQQVSFGDPEKTGAAFKKAAANGLEQTEKVDLRKLNPNAGTDDANSILDIAKEGKQEADLSKKLADADKKRNVGKSFDADAKAYDALAKQPRQPSSGRTTSYEAFEAVMSDITSDAIKKDGKGATSDAINDKDANVSITLEKPTKPPGATGASAAVESLDDTLRKAIDTVN